MFTQHVGAIAYHQSDACMMVFCCSAFSSSMLFSRQANRVTFLAGSRSKQCLIHCAGCGLIGTAYDNQVELDTTQC